MTATGPELRRLALDRALEDLQQLLARRAAVQQWQQKGNDEWETPRS